MRAIGTANGDVDSQTTVDTAQGDPDRLNLVREEHCGIFFRRASRDITYHLLLSS